MNEQMADFFYLYREYSDKFEEVENYIDEHTDANGTVSNKHAEIVNQKEIELKKLRKQLQKTYDKLEVELSKSTSKPILNYPGDPFSSVETHERKGVSGNDYHRKFFNQFKQGFRGAYDTLQESLVDKGGYLVPTEFHEEIISELKNENILRQISTVIETANDRKISIVSNAPTANFVSEAQEIQLSTESFTQKTLSAYKLATGVSVSNELLADSYYNLENHLSTEFAKAIGAAEENALLNGTGTVEPLGLIPVLEDNSSTMTTAAAGNNLSADDLINLCYSLKRPYRKNACWLMNDSSLAAVRKLKDSDQNYIWQNFTNGEPDKILGYPVYTSPYMPSIASGKIPVIFGDFSKFFIGQRGQFAFKPLYELHALRDLSTFLMIERFDGILADNKAIRGLRFA